jgi:hypothetical protein
MKPKRFVAMICLILLAVGLGQGFGKSDKLEKFHQLNHDIVLLNLANGMHLTKEQIKTLMEKIEEAEQTRETFEHEITSREKGIESVLSDLRKVLMRGEDIPDDLKHRVHKMKEIQHNLQDEMGDKLIQIQEEVKAILTPNQLLVIDEYKPCTIPPQLGKIGQSVESAAAGIAKMLYKIRNLNRNQYEMAKEMYIDLHLDKLERHLKVLSQEEKEAEKDKIESVFEEARSLSDQDFLVQKGDLARQLLPPEVKVRQPKKNQLDRVGHFLLDPSLLPILKYKLKMT